MEPFVYFGTSDDRTTVPIEYALVTEFTGLYAPGQKVVLEISGVTFQILASLRKIMMRLPLIPTLDLISQAEVLLLLQITRSLRIPDQVLVEGSFKDWTDDARWVKMTAPHLLYLVHTELEELVDFPKYIRLAYEPFQQMLKIVTSPEYNIERRIAAIGYFKSIKIETCFNMNNAKVQAIVAKLRQEQAAFARDPLLLINPYEHIDYLKYTVSEDPVWSCNGIAPRTRPGVSESTIVPLDVALARFNEFTCGLFSDAYSVQNPFPWDNVVFAGGGATKILLTEYDRRDVRASDVDLFPIGAKFEDRKKVLEQVIAWFAGRGSAYFAIRGSVITVYLKGIARKFQIVSSNAQSVSDVIGRFDTSHIQNAYDGKRFLCTPAAAQSLRDRIARFGNTANIRPVRLIKAMLAGFDIEKSMEIIDKIIDITTLVEDPKNPQLGAILQEINTYYYPAPMLGYDPEEETAYIMAMCCKDANATMVTNDPKVVWNNVTVSGDFNNCYESTQFTTFNAAVIQNKNRGRVMSSILKSKHGAIRLTSDFAEVVKVNTGDDGVNVVLKITPAFTEFVSLLEGNIYRMFRQGGVGVKAVSEAGTISLTVARHTIDNQLARGQTIIRNQKAVPLDLEEDLKAGDRVQFMFLIEMKMADNDRRVVLKPLRFIKYVSDDTEHVEAETDDNVNIDVDAVVARVTSEAIAYDD